MNQSTIAAQVTVGQPSPANMQLANLGREVVLALSSDDTPQSYHAQIKCELLDPQGALLDWVIGFAFDTLDAQHLDLRVLPCDS